MSKHTLTFTFVTLALLLALSTAGAQSPEPTGIPDDTPEGLKQRFDRAVDSGNVETALYTYRSLFHVTGEEDVARLGEIAGLVIAREMRRGGWLRLTAAEALARAGDPRGFEVLRAALNDPDLGPSHRRQAMQVLGTLGDEASIPVLQPLVYDRDRSMDERMMATEALLMMGDLHGVAFLVRVLEGDDLSARIRAAEICARRRLALTEPLRKAAQSEHPTLRAQALRALALQGDERAIQGLHAELGEGGIAPIRELAVEHPTDPEQPPKEYRDYRDFSRSYGAAEALLESGDPSPVPYLLEAARDPRSPFSAADVARQVMEIDPEQATALLEEIIAGDGPYEVRVSAGVQLVGIGKPEGVLEMLRAIYEETSGTDARRLLAVQALAKTRLPGCEGVLRTVVKEDPSSVHRLRAAEGLARMGDPVGLRHLRQTLDGADRVEAIQAAQVLMEVAARDGATGTG